MNLNQYLEIAVQRKASDLHLIAGSPPVLRIDGQLLPAGESALTSELARDLVHQALSPEQKEQLTINKELDFSFSYSSTARFRVNAYYQRGSVAAAFRIIPMSIPSIDQLNLPKICHQFTVLRQGFILVTGPTGHGKSTTLAAILDEINRTRPVHIVTIEDPIEFVFSPQRAMISQREMRADTHSWEVALRSALREDPDVVLVGEMRDYETIASALTIAETGHLVFATLHTNSAAQTIDRIIDVFPREQQNQVRIQLAMTIEAVLSLRLLPALPSGRIPAYEVMVATPAVKSSIREGKTHQLDNIIQTSGQLGMVTLENTLTMLVKAGKVSLNIAKEFSLRPEEVTRLVTGKSG